MDHVATIYWPAVARGAAGAPYSSRLSLLQTLHQYTSWHTSSHCGCGTSLHSVTVMSSHSVLSVGTHTCTRHVTRVTTRYSNEGPSRGLLREYENFGLYITRTGQELTSLSIFLHSCLLSSLGTFSQVVLSSWWQTSSVTMRHFSLGSLVHTSFTCSSSTGMQIWGTGARG